MAAHPTTPTKGCPFLEIPAEIRLQIYEELLVRDGESVLCAGENHPNVGHEFHQRGSLFPEILRTNKSIYEEALPTLYSKNKFNILCDLNDRYVKVSEGNRFIECANELARGSLKTAVAHFTFGHYHALDGYWLYFEQSWDKVEAELLDIYPNIEHLTIAINCATVIHMDMARKQAQLKPEIAQSYKEYLASERFSVVQPDVMYQIEVLCDEILHHGSEGKFKSAVFAVKAVRWTTYCYEINDRDSAKLESKEHQVYLGCYKHRISLLKGHIEN